MESVLRRVIQVSNYTSTVKGFMTYKDFCKFVFAVNNKNSAFAIEYWFRVLDTDDDGVLSLFELEAFWNEQSKRMASFADPWKFHDFLCGM